MTQESATAFFHPAASSARIGFFSFALLKSLVDSDAALTLDELLDRVPIARHDAARVLANFVRGGLLDASYRESARRRVLQVRANQSSQELLAGVTRGSDDPFASPDLISALEGIEVRGAVADPSTLAQLAHVRLREQALEDLALMRPDGADARDAESWEVITRRLEDPSNEELFLRLRCHAYMQILWERVWLNRSFYERLYDLQHVSIFLDTNVLVGLLAKGDLWHSVSQPLLGALASLRAPDFQVDLLLADETYNEFLRLLDTCERLVWSLKRLHGRPVENKDVWDSLRKYGLVRDFFNSRIGSFATYRGQLATRLQWLVAQHGIIRAPADVISREAADEVRAQASASGRSRRGITKNDEALLIYARTHARQAGVDHSWVWTYDHRLPELAQEMFQTPENVAFSAFMPTLAQSLWMVRQAKEMRFDQFQSRVTQYMEDYFRSILYAERRSLTALDAAIRRLVSSFSAEVAGQAVSPRLLARITEDTFRLAGGTGEADRTDDLSVYIGELDEILGWTGRFTWSSDPYYAAA